MPTISLPAMQIVHRDPFLFQPMYRATRKWLLENEYAGPGHDETMQSAELIYWHRQGTSRNPSEREVRIWWRLEKLPAPLAATGGSGIYTHHIDIDWNVLTMVDTEMMYEGKKIKAQYGELILDIRPYLVVSDFSGVPVLKYFKDWIMTRLIKKNLEEHRKMLYQDAYRLQGMLKKYLELKAWLPVEEELHEKFEFL